jgi:Tol biopolymer transport system component
MTKAILAGAIALALLAAPGAQQPPPSQQPPTPPPQQPSEIVTTISGEGGAPPRLAVPDFIPLSPDAETAAIAKTIGQVLWDDLNFEREFSFIPRDTYASIPRATSFTDVPFDRWRELNADGLVVGTVQKVGTTIKVEMRLFNVRTAQSAFGRQYDGTAANPRLFAHTISDEIHKTQRALNGVARSS